MKLTTAVLAAAAVMSASNLLIDIRTERRHRQLLDLGTVALHQNLCSDITKDPAQSELWVLDGLSPVQMARSTGANRQIAFTQAKHRLGLTDKNELRVPSRT
ncbi:hypothetical protein [Streptomyces sp. NPDC058861]|uniref:hypothetical protein n=1 Tax=Streptomyces sp. NPDC058861 TaxID=3346653 RepID=UPI0036A6652F